MIKHSMKQVPRIHTLLKRHPNWLVEISNIRSLLVHQVETSSTFFAVGEYRYEFSDPNKYTCSTGSNASGSTCPSLSVIDVIDHAKSCEPPLQESDDPAYQRPSRHPNVLLVMHPQFYLLKDFKSFSFITKEFNVVNFLWSDIEQCAKNARRKVSEPGGIYNFQHSYIACSNGHFRSSNLSISFMRTLAQELYPHRLFSYLVHPGSLYASSLWLVLISFLRNLALTSSHIQLSKSSH